MRLLSLLLIATAPAAAAAQFLPTQPPERCARLTTTKPATEWLDQAIARVMPPPGDTRVLRYRVVHDIPFWEQSDRMYPPFIVNASSTNRWYSPSLMVEGRQLAERALRPGDYPSQLFTTSMAYSGRDSTLRESPFPGAAETPLRENPWMVLSAWRGDAANVTMVDRCTYRDAPRVVLQRKDERLYLSESDATPIKLERAEPHYLWGQVKTEYLWMTWWGVRGATGVQFPLSTYRILDGEIYERIGVQQGSAGFIAADSAPRLAIANAQSAPPVGTPGQLVRPDTVRVGDNTFLLVLPQYTHSVTLQRDTIFLFDATTSEARSRADSAVIASLFPGRHPIVLVVTDLAWLHISGLRFWVARGATVVSHRSSQDFLRRVVERKWTLNPDALEKSRATARFRFRPVDDSLKLGGGSVVVHALRGSSTETAVGVWMPALRYFWAGDYVQNSPDSPYARDIARTIRDLGVTPLKIGAQHIKLSDWTDIQRSR